MPLLGGHLAHFVLCPPNRHEVIEGLHVLLLEALVIELVQHVDALAVALEDFEHGAHCLYL